MKKEAILYCKFQISNFKFKMLTSLKRIIIFGWKNFCNNIEPSITTCFILVVVIFFITSLFLLKGVSEHLISSIREKADITIFLKEDLLEEDILKLKEELVKMPEVKEVEYVSKEQALEKFTKKHKDEPEIMRALGLFNNPLPSSLNIKAFEAAQYPALVSFLENSSFSNLIEEVDYPQRKLVIERIFGITEAVKKAGIITSLILAIIAILVAFNTVRLAIYNSREEIKIQRLVGASNWFVRGPFIVQGIIAGFFSVVFSFFMILGILYFLSPKIGFFLSGFDLLNYFFINLSTIILIQLATGLGLGVISSYIATRKYLEV